PPRGPAACMLPSLPARVPLPPCLCFFLTLLPSALATLFPYTTLFRSVDNILCVNKRFSRLGATCGSIITLLIIASHHLAFRVVRSEEHTSELQSRFDLVCRLLLDKKNVLSADGEHAPAFQAHPPLPSP